MGGEESDSWQRCVGGVDGGDWFCLTGVCFVLSPALCVCAAPGSVLVTLSLLRRFGFVWGLCSPCAPMSDLVVPYSVPLTFPFSSVLPSMLDL